MEEQIEFKYVTVGDLKAWVYHGSGPSYVSEETIARQRAYAIAGSPVVTDDTVVMSVLLVDGKPAAFCACMPDEVEMPERRIIYWYSALYCRPEFQGRGYGMFVLSHLNEAHEGDIYDIDAIAETDECLKFLGYRVSSFSQYRVLFSRSICRKGLKGQLAYWRENFSRVRNVQRRMALYMACVARDYSLEYVSCIDDELYGFIREHSSGDAMLRSRRVFDWMLSYPMVISAPVRERLAPQNPFASEVASFHIMAVKVMSDGQTAGFYILREKGTELSVKYLYYDRTFTGIVFDSILAHVIVLGTDVLLTDDKALADFIYSKGIHHRMLELPVSVSSPSDSILDTTLHFQAGDGDMLT